MIKIYYRPGCNSSQNTFLWFSKYRISVQKKRIAQITQKDMINVLSFTSLGIPGLIKQSNRMSRETKKKIAFLKGLHFKEALQFLQDNPNLIRTPIIIENDKVLIGYNYDEIRMFLPRKYRRSTLFNRQLYN